jgi:hypothetical protein
MGVARLTTLNVTSEGITKNYALQLQTEGAKDERSQWKFSGKLFSLS